MAAAATIFLAAPATSVSATSGDDVEVVQTDGPLTQRLEHLPAVTFRPGAARAPRVIHVNDGVRFQRVTGFGAAMTDSSAWLLARELGADARAATMAALFGTNGIHLGFLRVPIGASDFTKDGVPYSYDDMPPGQSDFSLTHFSLAHDDAYVLPALREALAINPRMQILASQWSPPAWMKTNSSLSNVRNRGKLRSSAHRAWSDYLVKFIQGYERAGVPISAITAQNEPTNPTHYPGLNLPEATASELLTRELEPALRAAHVHPKLYGDDWGWGARAFAYAKSVVKDRAAGGLTGIAWHCYFGSPYLMSTIHRMSPRLDEIVDECSPGITPIPTSEVVIASMRNWASTVALWNLALDPRGGPVEPPNTGCPSCTGLLKIDERTGSVTPTRAYYQLGQASEFLQPGARRIDTEHFVVYAYKRPGVNFVTPGLDDVAFVNPDGSLVLIAYDNSGRPRTFTVQWHQKEFTYTLPGNAMATFVWNRRS